MRLDLGQDQENRQAGYNEPLILDGLDDTLEVYISCYNQTKQRANKANKVINLNNGIQLSFSDWRISMYGQ